MEEIKNYLLRLGAAFSLLFVSVGLVLTACMFEIWFSRSGRIFSENPAITFNQFCQTMPALQTIIILTLGAIGCYLLYFSRWHKQLFGIAMGWAIATTIILAIDASPKTHEIHVFVGLLVVLTFALAAVMSLLPRTARC